MNKYGAKQTWSEFHKRFFASKLEAKRADELWLLQLAGEITDLECQKKFVLCKSPKVSITVDFAYKDKEGRTLYEDTKGVLTRDFRTKLAWLREKFGIEVELVR